MFDLFKTKKDDEISKLRVDVATLRHELSSLMLDYNNMRLSIENITTGKTILTHGVVGSDGVPKTHITSNNDVFKYDMFKTAVKNPFSGSMDYNLNLSCSIKDDGTSVIKSTSTGDVSVNV